VRTPITCQARRASAPRELRAIAAATVARALADAAGDCGDLRRAERPRVQADAQRWLAGPDAAALFLALGVSVGLLARYREGLCRTNAA
jgi:hypothetical protein